MVQMKKIRFIREGENLHHLFIGDTDVWLTTMEVVELYKQAGHVKI